MVAAEAPESAQVTTAPAEQAHNCLRRGTVRVPSLV